MSGLASTMKPETLILEALIFYYGYNEEPERTVRVTFRAPRIHIHVYIYIYVDSQ